MIPMIVTTMLNVFIIDDDGGIHKVLSGDLSIGTAHYHGVTWDANGYVYLSETINFQYVIGIYTLNRTSLERKYWLDGDLHETHQIFYNRGILYAVNTGKNRIDYREVGVNSLDTLWPKPWRQKAFYPSPCDIDHINAIWIAPSESIYIAEHRQKSDKQSLVRCCNEETFTQLYKFPIGPNIHNVYLENGYVYNLTSPHDGKPAAILATFTGPGHSQVGMGFPEWGTVLLRGLARSKDHWYVGASRWDDDRSKRHVGDGVIAVLDNDFKQVDDILLIDSGPICDIRLLRGDMAHNGIDLI